MVTIVLDIADNGVVKILEDDNINGAGETFVSKTLYDFEGDGDFKNRIKFLKDLCLDIGLQTGNEIDKKRLAFIVGAGSKYKPTKPEIKAKIVALEKLLVKYKKQLEEDET